MSAAMKRLILAPALALAVAGAVGAPAGGTPSAGAVDSVSRAVGTVFGSYVRNSLQSLTLMGVEVDHATFIAALDSAVQGRHGIFDPQSADRYLAEYIDARRAPMRVDTLSVASQQAWLDSMAALPGAIRRPDGLVFIVEREGEGAMPADSSQVEIMYTGRFYDGVEFDRTDSPVTFAVADLTPGFSIGLTMMRPGGRYRLAIPSSLAYGPQGIPGAIPGNAALDFTVDLIRIIK